MIPPKLVASIVEEFDPGMGDGEIVLTRPLSADMSIDEFNTVIAESLKIPVASIIGAVVMIGKKTRKAYLVRLRLNPRELV